MFPCMTRKGCPERRLKPGEKGFCPVWFDGHIGDRPGLLEKRGENDVRPLTGCLFQLMPYFQLHTLTEQECTSMEISKMRERTAQHISQQVRGALLDGFMDMVSHKGLPRLLPDSNGAGTATIQAKDQRQITAGSGGDPQD